MIGCLLSWKCILACRCGEESQQPTCPHVRHIRKCTHLEPILRQSSQPSALGVIAAVLSISVGMLNLLPVPLLDGGHLVYYAAEAIRGKAMNARVQQFGFDIGGVLLTSLMF